MAEIAQGRDIKRVEFVATAFFMAHQLNAYIMECNWAEGPIALHDVRIYRKPLFYPYN